MTTDSDASGSRLAEIDEPQSHGGATMTFAYDANGRRQARHAGTDRDRRDRGERGDIMRDLLGLAFDAAVSLIGVLAAGYTLWQGNTYVRLAGTLPRRAARLWKWRIVLGLCGSFVVMCFGSNDLLLHHAAFAWLLLLEGGAGAGFAAVLFMRNNPEWNASSQRREPDDDASGRHQVTTPDDDVQM